jgi:uracil-DNA glycosylase family 4
MSASMGTNQVALIGEALGEAEAEIGMPFQGKAGFRLTRLIEYAGLNREDFSIWNAAWCRPPDNKLEGLPFEYPAISHCREAHWGKLVQGHRVLVPLGNVPTHAVLGFKSILSTRGYVYPGPEGTHVVPTVHPAFIARGNSRWSAAFINDLQKAVLLARGGLPVQFVDYTLDPSPLAAYQWAQAYRQAWNQDQRIRLAFDIETPGKGEDEEDVDTDSDAPDATWHIHRIGFSYRGLHALSIPWEPAFMAAIRLLLEGDGEKIVWNSGFDVPRIRRAGVRIPGIIHDGMVAWHILHSDLPKKLGFVATFVCPWQPAWKHLSGAKPAFYNATDADVEWRAMEVIERELRQSGLWDVYQRDVLDLEPILIHMQERGMPVDNSIRADRAVRLSLLRKDTLLQLERVTPIESRKIEHVYVKPPKDTSGLLQRPARLTVRVCDRCGARDPRADHFKVYKKKVNLCAGAGRGVIVVDGQEWYRLASFTPSRDQLIRYHQHLGRQLPTIYDRKEKKRKVSFDEKALKKLILAYPLDPVYPLVLEYRSLDKIAGTYIGRPVS